MNQTAVGKPMNRVDGPFKVTGTAHYSAEFPLDKVAHAVALTSTIARGRINALDTRAAEAVPGLLSIITHLNAPSLKPVPTFSGGGSAAENRLPLQEPVIHHSGQYIGIVIAETLEQATYAAELVRVTYDEETPLVEIEQGETFAPKAVLLNRQTMNAAILSRGWPRLKYELKKLILRPSSTIIRWNPMQPWLLGKATA